MLDDKALRRKVLLRLLGNPLTVVPFIFGMTTMAATWAMNWRPELGLFAGVAGVLGSAGAYVTQLLVAGDRVTREAAAELEAEAKRALQSALDQLDHQLTHADTDVRPETCLRELRALLKAYEDSTGAADATKWNKASAYEVESMIRQMFDRCIDSLRQTDRLWQTAQGLQTPGARKPILEQRERIISEVEASIKHLSHTLVALQTLDRESDSTAQLARIRGELDQSLAIARTVEERVNALVKEAVPNHFAVNRQINPNGENI